MDLNKKDSLENAMAIFLKKIKQGSITEDALVSWAASSSSPFEKSMEAPVVLFVLGCLAGKKLIKYDRQRLFFYALNDKKVRVIRGRKK